MRRIRPVLHVLLAAVLTLFLAGCAGGGNQVAETSSGGHESGENSTAAQNNPEDFQKNLHQTQRETGLPTFLEGDSGYYMGFGSLYFIERDTGKATILCAKPDCDHTDSSICNAMINANYLLMTHQDKLYYIGNGNHPKIVGSVRQDATGRETVQELKFNEFSSSQSSRDKVIYHRGYLYYVSDDILYRVKLGEEKDAAETIWAPEDAGSTQSHGNLVDYNPNAIRYTLWADGDSLYFMANVQMEDGTYKDVLFQCGLDGSDVRQVWVTPDKDQVGEWEETGVSVSQWYVLDGFLYFYLSGNDYYRTDLSTGETEKLADTHQQTQYGSAIFSDTCLCLLNDEPTDFNGSFELGGIWRKHADAIFLYGLDGTYRKEISLQSAMDALGDNLEMELLMADDTDVYFQVTTTVYNTQYGMSVGDVGSITVWKANFETGEVSQIIQLR